MQPLTVIVLAVLLTAEASHSLTAASERKSETAARAVALRMEDCVSEGRGDPGGCHAGH
jgi:hypothetical protein